MVGGDRGDHRVVLLLHPRDVGRRDLDRAEPGGLNLQQAAREVELEQLGVGETPHDRGAVGDRLGEVPDAESVAGSELAVHDRGEDRAEDLVADAAAQLEAGRGTGKTLFVM